MILFTYKYLPQKRNIEKFGKNFERHIKQTDVASLIWFLVRRVTKMAYYGKALNSLSYIGWEGIVLLHKKEGHSFHISLANTPLSGLIKYIFSTVIL